VYVLDCAPEERRVSGVLAPSDDPENSVDLGEDPLIKYALTDCRVALDGLASELAAVIQLSF